MKKTVFLPCHPNMWEGFETIWDKESSDPNNMVIVIPVPTYQRGENNSLYDAEYITAGYPDNVVITGLNDFDFESEHPDTIYIQNIQDADDPVFTVHPSFYTSKLKACTDNLVYIPYHCMPDIDTDYNYLKRVYARLIAPPGIHNVDSMIVHSENERTVYLALLSALDDGLWKQWEPKITCDDYPRISILKKYTKETVPYPASWNRHLFDSLGNRKECILLSTSIFGVLEFNRSQFRATKEVFEEFLTIKDSKTLIWRPHKYLPEVIMQMRPELFNDFRELLEFYIKNDVGIFDETPAPTPAIILSDSYIGDECSVKELFKATGKPVTNINL